ncbi:hypothetical protein [Calothrix sp. CCY 0018]|uniref:hypothetical protein n=1 Tax=Calothrix sp. CCY 0018 TaxID=3103864 RepID=UPI0039C64ACC
MSFTYRECKVQIERDTFNQQDIYAAWVNHDAGCAIAVPYAATPNEAIKKSKQWIDKRFNLKS